MTMPRSAADATRFTATGPHADSKTSRPSPSTVAPGGGGPTRSSRSAYPPGPPGETPQQKVARLKEASKRAKLDQISTFDKIVVRGRIWADRAHTVVALSLIGASVICGIYATVALSDMVMYNRRKRREFYASQSELYRSHLAEASDAVREGTATASQIRLLDGERAMQQDEQERKNKKLWNRSKNWLYGGMKRDDVDDAAMPSDKIETRRDLTGQPTDGQVLKAVKELEAERQSRDRKEGMLDAMGEEAAQSVSESVAAVTGGSAAGGGGGGGWGSWFRSKKGGDGER